MPDDAETEKELFDRAKNFLEKTIDKHPNDTVLFVCHGGILSAFDCVIKGLTPEDILTNKVFWNTSVTIFCLKENNHHIELFNCVNHLNSLE